MAIVDIPAIPTTLEEFIKLRVALSVIPEGAAAMMILALLISSIDEYLGRECLAAASHSENLWEGSEGYQGMQLSRGSLEMVQMQVAGKSYLLHSYFKGTRPENGYRLPDPPYHIEFFINRYSGDILAGWIKLFVNCSGSSSPRPVLVKQEKSGEWRASEWSSLIVGIIPPKV
jgi:hypothetical protein